MINQPNSTIDSVAPLLPSGKYDVPLVIQDKTFYANGSLYFPTVGSDPNDYPYWFNDFLGDTNVVNGKVWPNMNVDQGQYQFPLLIASDTRVYNLTLFDPQTNTYLPFTQIGSDGGYLKSAASLTSLEIGTAERADILVDFSGLPVGSKILLENKSVFNASEAQTVGQVMQFTVTGNDGFKPETLPTLLNPTLAGPFPNLPAPSVTRIMPLFALNGPTGSASMFLINGQSWDATPLQVKVGATEDWAFVDLTDSDHEMHLHLIQFQIVSRQAINATKYATDWIALQRQALGNSSAVPPWPDNFIPKELPVQPYLIGNATPAPPNEQGWKDTVLTQPYTVTIIRVRFAQQDGSPFPFDATKGPGYVFHCHLLDHEDNMMMLRYQLVSSSPPNSLNMLILIAAAILAVFVIVAVSFLIVRRRRLKKKS
jgi:FtsP/CotA-like multicopper oxidase with cupredoxin domain